MTEYILLGIMAVVTVLLLLMRTNTGVVFLALCAGTLLLSAAGVEVSLFASSLSSGLNASVGIAKIAVLLSPALVCAVFLRKQIPRSKAIFAFVPALAIALLAALLVVPLLSEGLQGSIGSTEIWEILHSYQSPIVTTGIVASVITIAFTISKPDHGKEKHKKGKH